MIILVIVEEALYFSVIMGWLEIGQEYCNGKDID